MVLPYSSVTETLTGFSGGPDSATAKCFPLTPARRPPTSTVLPAGTVPPNVIGCSTGAFFVFASIRTVGGAV